MKKILVLIMALLMSMAMASCADDNEPQSPPESGNGIVTDDKVETLAFTITVNGITVTEADMAAYELATYTTTTVNSKGTETTATYVGYEIEDVLEVVGVDDFTILTATATDGYSIEYTEDVATEDETILGLTKDGEAFEEGPYFAPCESGVSGDYLKALATIETK